MIRMNYHGKVNKAAQLSTLRTILVLLMMLFSNVVSSDTYPSLRFEIPRIDGELSKEVVNSAIIDNSGFLWFCTDDGLVRYDGYTTKRYRHDPNNAQSISTNSTRIIIQGSGNFLWVGSIHGGVNLFNPESETFTRYLTTELIDSVVRNLFLDSNGMLWVSTDSNGVFGLNLSTKEVTHLKPNRDLSHQTIFEVLEDIRPLEKGNLWIATAGGLDYFDRSKNKITHFISEPANHSTLDDSFILDLFYDKSDKLWVVTVKGLNEYIPESKSFRRHKLAGNVYGLTEGTEPVSIYQDKTSKFWISSLNGGIYQFNPDTNTVQSYKHSPYYEFSLRNDGLFLNSLFEDGLGGMWLLTDKGVNRLNTNAFAFRNYRHEPGNSDTISSNNISQIYEDRTKQLWIATDAGLNYYDRRDKKFRSIKHDTNDSTSINDNRVLSVLVDKDQSLWVGTHTGLNRRSKNESAFYRFNIKSDNAPGLSDSSIISLLEDSKGNIWIGTANRLLKYNKKTKNFKSYLSDSKNPRSLSQPTIFSMYEDTQKRLWFGTGQGFNLYNAETDDFTAFTYEPNTNSLNGTVVYTITQSKNGHLWLGTESSGLNRFDIENNNFKHYGKKDGLASNQIFGIIEDNNNMLWISTAEGLSRFDPSSETFYNFYPEDGVQMQGFRPFASVVRDNGEIVLGGNDGIDRFFPDELKISLTHPPVVITDFFVLNQKVNPLNSTTVEAADVVNKSLYLKKSISYTKELTLTHKESLFSFEFAALDYLRPNKNQYAYKMEGLDEDWIHTPASKRFATYMNVPPGEYTFRVKGSNKNGVWNEEGKSMKVIILPPPWLTWWAKTIYVILTISLLLGIYAFRTRSLRRRASELEKTVKSRTLELAQEKTKVEKLLEQKNEEFANVSHEFRTPLTLVLGPLTKLLNRHRDPEDQKQLNIIQRNGYRLLRMVDQLLNLETFRVKPITQRVPLNTAQSIKVLVEAFTELAEQKHIKLSIKQLAEVNFEFSVDAFEKIILNLLSNALKYTKPDGLITVESIRKDNQLIIQISDTGIGIPADKLDDIFERFNRVLDKNSEQVTGAGIGLALVKNLVEAHQGKIKIESELDRGTKVKVTLPILNEVDENQTNATSSDEIIAMELMSLTEQTKTPIDNDIEKSITTQNENDKPTILVIEDNQDMRDYIVGSIADDYQTLTASNGEEGIELAKREVPDLIVSDIMMPQKDGFETTKALRNDDITSHIPIILLTALGDHENRIKGWQEKADEYLTKPFNVDELKTRIVNLLAIRSILKKRFSESIFDAKKESSESVKINNDESGIAEKSQYQLQEKFVNLLNEKLEIHYDNTSISVADIARALTMSERQIARKLKSTLDMTPTEYLRRFRLDKAREKLRQGKSATETAYDVGFSSPSYFAKCFKAQYGVSPSGFVNES